MAGALRTTVLWIGVITTGIGVAACGLLAAVLSRDAEVARRWQPVPGELLEATAVEHEERRSRADWKVAVRYRYRVEGRDFESTTLEPGDIWYRQDLAELVVRRLREQPNRTVWVDPSEPSRSVLRHKLEGGWWPYLLVGPGTLSVGLLLMLGAWWTGRRR